MVFNRYILPQIAEKTNKQFNSLIIKHKINSNRKVKQVCLLGIEKGSIETALIFKQ